MAESDFFTELEEKDKRTNILSTVSSPVWSKGVTTLAGSHFFLSSTQSGSSGDYYYDVYDTDPASDDTATVQFAVTYGHYAGSGSVSTNNGNNPSKAIYRQFRNICIKNPSSETKFKFDALGNGTAAKLDVSHTTNLF